MKMLIFLVMIFNLELFDKIEDVKVTAYTLSRDECCGDPNVSAIGYRPIPFQTVAVSRDLDYLMRKYIYIEDMGFFFVNDRTNKRLKNTVDVVFDTKKNAFKHGKKRLKVYIIKEEGPLGDIHTEADSIFKKF